MDWTDILILLAFIFAALTSGVLLICFIVWLAKKRIGRFQGHGEGCNLTSTPSTPTLINVYDQLQLLFSHVQQNELEYVEDVEESSPKSSPKSTPVLSTDYTESMGAMEDDSETKSLDIEEIKKPLSSSVSFC